MMQQQDNTSQAQAALRGCVPAEMSRRLIRTPSAKSVEPADLEEEGDGLRTTASSLPFTPITLVFRQV